MFFWIILQLKYHHSSTCNFLFFLDNQIFVIHFLNFIMVFNFSLFLSSTPEIFSSGLKCHIRLTILISFLSSLITFVCFTWPFSFSFSVLLSTKPENNLPLAPKGKPLLMDKGSRFLNLFQPFFILAKTLSIAHLLALVLPR